MRLELRQTALHAESLTGGFYEKENRIDHCHACRCYLGICVRRRDLVQG
jgi:hypothetical protein